MALRFWQSLEAKTHLQRMLVAIPLAEQIVVSGEHLIANEVPIRFEQHRG